MSVLFKNSFGTESTLTVGGKQYRYHRLAQLEKGGWTHTGQLPCSIKILLENLLRSEDGSQVTGEDIEFLLSSPAVGAGNRDIPFKPSRVILQDFTGIPAIVDLAAMRDTFVAWGGDPDQINPLIQADLVIDHSIQVDAFGKPGALAHNERLESERNRERYALLRWAQKAFKNLRVVPPGRGIVHQVNLEYFARVIDTANAEGHPMAYPDTVLGTDSHTTMVNGLGVLGWGVGGIEAEAVMLGQPYFMVIPEVIGVKLVNGFACGITATDLVLHLTELLRHRQVVGKFVEFFGPGLGSLSLPDRATIANMSPEFGATAAFFPVDDKTLQYLRLTGRDEEHIQLVEAYTKEQGLFGSEAGSASLFSDLVMLDLSLVEPCVAGPKRPNQRVPLSQVPTNFRETLRKPPSEWGFALQEGDEQETHLISLEGSKCLLEQGTVVIAAITSCTNTSNPTVMMAAGLLARNALQRGIRTKPWVKTSLAPGSRVVTDYLEQAGLLKPLEEQGFFLVGYGCTTCIGNSGPLPGAVAEALRDGNLVVTAVLSGNRNFEGRIHGAVKANYLASPPLVVAYALAGKISIDFKREPIGTGSDGKPVFLEELWPSDREIDALVSATVTKDFFIKEYQEIFAGNSFWENLPVPQGGLYPWNPESTYIRRPSFFEGFTPEAPPLQEIAGARVLLMLGDSVTTDHISPAGVIPPDSPAGRYLISQGVRPEDFNSYGARRGNHEVLTRGTFANIRLQNRLVEGVTGGFTRHFPTGEITTVWEAARRYRAQGTPLIVLAGKEYGAGSSRDWAAKGPSLLGVKAVIAESYERIHRSNLIGMGVLPLQFPNGSSAASLGLTGEEFYAFPGIVEDLAPGKELDVEAATPEGRRIAFRVHCRLDTSVELGYFKNGGILPTTLRNLLKR
ncbi:MAG: aconitate hydratase AcnA [Deltaproteobacteria bacterium]|nr:aconitate hydratase AcnA [Deltaproteobacteria bacterium]